MDSSPICMDLGAQEDCTSGSSLGIQYMRRLNDRRRVILNGKVVDQPDRHPDLAGAVRGIVDYYDAHENDSELHTVAGPDGNIPVSLAPPRAKADLEAKRRSYKAIAESSFGMLGRTPDFMNAAVMAIAHHSDVLGSNEFSNFSENARSLYSRCCDENLFVAHAAINPQINRECAPGSVDHAFRAVKIVARDKDGIVVQGAKMIATLAPIADELLVFSMPGLASGDEPYAVAFSIPVNAAGVTMVCRKAFNHPGYTDFDHPLANRFDEIDSYVIFQNVKVPWDRVLVDQDVRQSNAFYDATYARHHTGQQGVVRGLAKAEFVIGVALRLAEVLGLDNQPAIQSKLGGLASQTEALRALIHLAEHDATQSDHGILAPSIVPIQSFRLMFPPLYRQALELMRTMAPGTLLSGPNSADLDGETAELLAMALTTPQANAHDRTFALNLAWDLVGDAFGQRQLTYEYYHAGSPEIISRGQFRNYSWENERRLVDNIQKQ